MRGPVALAAVAAALAVALVPAGARGATARSGSSRTDATVCPTDTWGTSVTNAGHVGWIRSLPASPTGGGLPGPVNAAGVVIFAGDSDLTAFRNAGGGRLWNIHLNPVNGEPASFAGLWASTTAAYTLVKYSVAGKPTERLVELDPNTGKTLWGISLGGYAENVNANGNVYGFAVGGTIVAVDLFTNRVLWRQKFGRPARDGSYNTQLAWAGGYIVAVSGAATPGATTGTAAGFVYTTGKRAWRRTGIPNQPHLAAVSGTVLLSNGYGNSPKSTVFPMTGLAAATGKTLWRVKVKHWVTGVWTSPGVAAFTDSARIYEVDTARGLRWSVSGRPGALAMLHTDLVYVQAAAAGPGRPPVDRVYDRQQKNGALRWTRPGDPAYILAPDGPTLVLVNSSPLSPQPGTSVYAVYRKNGKQLHPAVALPAAVLTPPGVFNSGTYIELNPRECEPGSLATEP